MSKVQPIRLTEEQIDHYNKKGYVVVRDLLTEQEVMAFLENQSHPKPPEMQKGLLTHTVDHEWEYIAKHPNVAGAVAQIIGGTPRIVQTMYLAKKPAGEEKIGGAGIALHQDARYLPNEPNTLMACWIAMNDTDPENGGLCVVPGSHLSPLRSAHRNMDEDHVSWEHEYLFRDRDGREWKEIFYSFQIDGLDENEIVRLTVPRGSGVFFAGMIIHGSYANRSPDRPRLAFAVHYVRDGTWVYRADVQDTVPVASFSTPTARSK